MEIYNKSIISNISIFIFFSLKLTFILIYFPSVLSNKNKLRNILNTYRITMKIKGEENTSVSFFKKKNGNPEPDKIIINGVDKGSGFYSYIFTEEINFVELIWNTDEKFKTCNALFSDLSNILEIDLSEFDTSSVSTMLKMFYNCESLTSINFGNFNTEQVTTMANMFGGCSSIKYLDLTSFNTKKLKNTNYMFDTCSKLISIDLSSFDTSQVTSMTHMFSYCTSLISLTLENFNASACKSCSDVFLGVSNLKYCYNDNSNLQKIDLAQKGERVCSDPCFTNDINKFSLLSWECVSNCDQTIYLYEYNSQCFRECPSETHPLDENSHLCVDDLNCYYEYFNYERTECLNEVPNGYYCNDTKRHTIDLCDEKCEKCTLESTLDNKCTLCNNSKGYYKKEDDDNENFDCVNVKPSGYYLDENIYKKCYNSCEDCTSLGDESDNKCTKCLDGMILINGNCNKGGCEEGQYFYYNEANEFKCTDNYNCPTGYKIIPNKMQCVNNCSKDNEYKYEFGNECVAICPEGYHLENNKCIVNLVCDKYYNYDYTGCENEVPIGYYCNDTNKKTIDKCDIKCKECTLESTQKKQCLSCNNEQNYFQKENDELNENNFINCYKDLTERYYLKDNIYISCYKTCKTCDESGTIINHNCKSCIDNYSLNGKNCYKDCAYNHYFDELGEYICTENEQCEDKYIKLIVETKECVEECSGEYKYEYENKCYNSCPPNSFYNYSHTGCIGSIPDGYYCNNLNERTIDKCYKTCKSCTEYGNVEEHKCTSCFEKFTLNSTNCYDICDYYYYFDESKEYKCTEEKKCNEKFNKLIVDINQCVEKCENEYKYEFKNKCYKYCPEGTYYDDENIKCIDSIPIGYYCNDTNKKTIDKCDIKCKECTLESTQKKQCLSCNNEQNYFQKENDELNENNFINCYKDLTERYYLKDNIYISCYKTCKTCDESGTIINHNCKSCIDNYSLNGKNCYKDCAYNHYFDELGEYICTENEQCEDKYIKLIVETKECVEECSGEYKYEYENKCYKSCPTNTYYNFTQTGCIDSIPKGFYCNDTYKKTIDKCNIKCDECSLESINKNLCISCNNEEDYYSKEIDITNIGTFINCYKGILDGYFFDETNESYKKCYKTCKSCVEVGEVKNHKCTECFGNSTKNDSNCYEKCEHFYYFDESGEYFCTENERCPTNYPKKIREKKLCVSKCIDDDEYRLESNNVCYHTCPEGTKPEDDICVGYLICPILYNYEHTECLDKLPDGYYINDTSAKTIDKCNIKCKTCSKENICLSCNSENGYFVKEEDPPNNKGFIECYNTTFEGYYLDISSQSYKKCYNKCKSCQNKGDIFNHKCSECFSNATLNETNCYEICNYKYYFDSSNEYHCTKKDECPKGYKLIKEKNKCINNCNNDEEYKYEFNNTCYKEPVNPTCTNDSIYINKNTGECLNKCKTLDFFNNICGLRNNTKSSNKDLMIQQIEYEIYSGELSLYLSELQLGEKKDLLINNLDINYQISTSNNQKIYDNQNISSIILGDCEDIIKTVYNIDKNQSLILFKVDYYQNSSKIPILGYEFFHPSNYSILNLSYCENSLISINYPVILEDDFFKYNPDNEYYLDDCYPYTTKYGTDILLEDRQKEYNNKKMSICESNCALKEYSEETQKSECICEIKKEQISISEVSNQDILLSYDFSRKDSFSSIFSTMKCYNTLFSNKGISKNISFYLLLFCFLSTSISSFLFYKYGYDSLIKIIENILLDKEKKTENENLDINEKGKTNEKVNQNCIDNIIKISTPKNKRLNNFTHKELVAPEDISSINNYSSNQKSISKMDLKNMKEISYSKKKILNISNKNKESENELSNYNDYEINNFNYRKAIESDKRTYFKYYISLIKRKHPLIFTFFNVKDFNSMIIKINLFFLSFCIYYFINGIFINNSTIHKLYEGGINYDIGYFIPNIIYSFIISHVLTSVIKYFSLSEKNINDIKNEYNPIKAKDKVAVIKKNLVIKYICFFTLDSVFELFAWYDLSTFSSVYQNTQFILIKNTLISISISFIYPFIINLLPGIFRLYSLKDARRRCFYNFSKIIQFI